MTSRRTMVRVQQSLFAAAVALGIGYWFASQSLGRQAAALDRPMTNAVRELNVALDRNPLLRGLDAAGREERLRSLDTAAANLWSAEQLARERSAADPELQARLQEPFQLFDFESTRAQMIADLRRLAGARRVTVPPAVLNGYPEFVGGLSRPSLLWAQLSLMNQVMVSATLNQPRQITAAESLPPRTHAPDPSRPPIDELSVRLEFFGTMESVQGVLSSLPRRNEELREIGAPEFPGAKQALYVDRFLLRNSTNRPGEVQAEIVVSSFIHPSDWTRPAQAN